MKQPRLGGRSARIRMLCRLRLLLSVIALILCGTIIFCAVSLGVRSGKQSTEETAQETASTQTVQTTPQTVPTETEPKPSETVPSVPEPQTPGSDGGYGQEEAPMPDGENAQPGNPQDGVQPEYVNRCEVQDTELNGGNAEMVPPTPELPDNAFVPFQEAQEQTTAATEPSEPETATAQTTEAVTTETETAAAESFATDVSNDLPQGEVENTNSAVLTLLIVCSVLLVLDLAGIVACTCAINKLRRQARRAPRRDEEVDSISQTVSNGQRHCAGASAITVGQLHNIGARPYQEDSSGVANLDDGVFAVVADGMGGLSGGDKVSQKIVYTMLEYSSTLRPGQMDGMLEGMLSGVTDAVNQMLGPTGLKKSGSTLMAVLVRDYRFHWITVGDSHIYLYHNGSLVQLNQEHNRGQDLLRQAIAGQLTFDEVRADPQKSGLTSYIGMGRLKYVEKSLYSIPLVPGDRILLMTDGVFNALPEEQICSILKQNPDVTEAAQQLEQAVVTRACPHQDNFTAVILGF